jgi:hypothetical protein
MDFDDEFDAFLGGDIGKISSKKAKPKKQDVPQIKPPTQAATVGRYTSPRDVIAKARSEIGGSSVSVSASEPSIRKPTPLLPKPQNVQAKGSTQQKRAAAEAKKRRADAKAAGSSANRKKESDKRKQDAEQRKQEAEQRKKEAEEQAHAKQEEEERKQEAEQQASMRREADAKSRKKSEEKRRRDAEERRVLGEEEAKKRAEKQSALMPKRLKIIEEAKARKLKCEQEAVAEQEKKAAEEAAKKEREERARFLEQAKKETEERAKREAEKKEAEGQSRREAAEQAKKEAQDRTREEYNEVARGGAQARGDEEEQEGGEDSTPARRDSKYYKQQLEKLYQAKQHESPRERPAPGVGTRGGASAEGRPAKKKQKNPLDVLQAIYTKHCPDKLSSVPQLLRKFKGREEDLLEKVKAKYGWEDTDGDSDDDAQDEGGSTIAVSSPESSLPSPPTAATPNPPSQLAASELSNALKCWKTKGADGIEHCSLANTVVSCRGGGGESSSSSSSLVLGALQKGSQRHCSASKPMALTITNCALGPEELQPLALALAHGKWPEEAGGDASASAPCSILTLLDLSHNPLCDVDAGGGEVGGMGMGQLCEGLCSGTFLMLGSLQLAGVGLVRYSGGEWSTTLLELLLRALNGTTTSASSCPLPKLRRLSLANNKILPAAAKTVAAELLLAPTAPRLEFLDLSMNFIARGMFQGGGKYLEDTKGLSALLMGLESARQLHVDLTDNHIGLRSSRAIESIGQSGIERVTHDGKTTGVGSPTALR